MCSAGGELVEETMFGWTGCCPGAFAHTCGEEVGTEPFVNGLGGLAGRHLQRYDDEYDRSSIIRILLQAVFPRPHSPSPSPAAPVTIPLLASPRSNLALPLSSLTLPPHSLSPVRLVHSMGRIRSLLLSMGEIGEQ